MQYGGNKKYPHLILPVAITRSYRASFSFVDAFGDLIAELHDVSKNMQPKPRNAIRMPVFNNLAFIVILYSIGSSESGQEDFAAQAVITTDGGNISRCSISV